MHHGTGRGMRPFVIVRRFVIKSLLFTCKWVGYGLMDRVRVRARARVSARVTVRDRIYA